MKRLIFVLALAAMLLSGCADPIEYELTTIDGEVHTFVGYCTPRKSSNLISCWYEDTPFSNLPDASFNVVEYHEVKR